MKARRLSLAIRLGALFFFGMGASACNSDTLGAVPCIESLDCSVGNVCVAGTCEESLCGDGFVDERIGEECDDQDVDNSDGCRTDCTSPLPQVLITEPTRGSTLSGEPEIVVRGTMDGFGAQISSVVVNGIPASFDQRNFETRIPARHGLTAVRADVTTEYGRTNAGTVGVYHSSAYLPFAEIETSTERIPAGIVSRLGQAAFDDGDHPCSFDANGAYGCTVVDDLATVGELVLNNLDFESEFGALPIYTDVYPLFERNYPLGQTNFNLLGLDVSIAGTMALQGQVNLTVDVVALDFDRFRVALATRTGGLDVDLEAGGGADPGVVFAVRTRAEIDAALRFTSVTGTIEGFDGLGLACALLSFNDPVAAGILASLCIQPDGRRAPLAGVSPFGQLNSDFSIEQISLFTGYNVETAQGGGVAVQLLGGSVEFQNSNIDLDLIADMLIDLDDAVILGGAATVDLGEIPLSGLAQGLSSAIDPITDFISNDLQALIEVGFNAFLLNRNDPLALGSVLEETILSFAPNGPLGVAPIGGRSPALELVSEIDAIRFESAGGNMNRGGMEISVASTYAAPRLNPREIAGTILRDRCSGRAAPSTLNFSEEVAIEQGVALDAMNQSLYATWYNGALDSRLTSLDATAPQLNAQYDVVFDPLTPPILDDCGGALELQIADVRVSGVVDGANIDAYVSLAIPVDVGVTAFGALDLIPAPIEQWRWQAEPVGADRVSARLLGATIAEVTGRALLTGGSNAAIQALPTVEIDLARAMGISNAPVLTHVPNASYRSSVYQVRSGARVTR